MPLPEDPQALATSIASASDREALHTTFLTIHGTNPDAETIWAQACTLAERLTQLDIADALLHTTLHQALAHVDFARRRFEELRAEGYFEDPHSSDLAAFLDTSGRALRAALLIHETTTAL